MLRYRQRLSIRLAATVAVSALACTSPALAQQTVLRAKGGDFEFIGKLKSATPTAFVLETPSGEVALDASQFDCLGAGCPAGERTAAVATERLTVHGSSTIGERLMPELIRAYARSLGADANQSTGERRNETRFRVRNAQKAEIATIDVQRYGSPTAFTALAKGEAQFGMSSRAIGAEEARTLAPLMTGGVVQNEHVLGLDAIVFIVAPGNPLASLSLDQIARIYAGQLTDWQELGVPAGPITVYAADAGSATFEDFKEQILKPRNLVTGAYVRRLDANAEIADAVAKDPRAIGMTSVASIRNVRSVPIAGTCGLVTEANAFSIKAENYPLSRRLYVYTAGPLQGGFAQGLLKYALSTHAQSAVLGSQFVDQRIDSIPYADVAARFQVKLAPGLVDPLLERQLLAELTPARQLSIAFRFATGSSEFQSKSRQDVQRLAELLQTPEYQKKTVALLGFTDDTGSPLANARLGQRRAEQARQAVLAAGAGRINPRQIAARGYGPLAPVACNDTLQGQQLNRRVEVWMRDLNPPTPALDPAKALRARQAQEATAAGPRR